MRYEKQKITPSVAEKLLKSNGNNRKARIGDVTKYATIMSNGDWDEDSPEAIIISENGDILNGQHRLMAIVKSKTTLNLWVGVDFPSSTFHCIDKGVKRSAGDDLTIMGIKYPQIIAGGIKSYLKIKAGYKNYQSTSITLYEKMITDTYSLKPEYWDAIAVRCQRYYKDFNQIISPAFIYGWLVALSELNEKDAEYFFDKLTTGIGINSKNDPVNMIRDFFIKSHADRHINKPSLTYQTAVFIKAWNGYRKKKQIMNLRWIKDNEDYPKPI